MGVFVFPDSHLNADAVLAICAALLAHRCSCASTLSVPLPVSSVSLCGTSDPHLSTLVTNVEDGEQLVPGRLAIASLPGLVCRTLSPCSAPEFASQCRCSVSDLCCSSCPSV